MEDSSENVEFAIKLQGDVLVPVDSHFPVERFKAIDDAHQEDDKKAMADADDDSNPMSDVFSFKDGDKNITLRYDLSSPLARFVAQNNQQLPSIYKRYAIQNVFRNEKAGNARYREFT